jgi:hypothetical protein
VKAVSGLPPGSEAGQNPRRTRPCYWSRNEGATCDHKRLGRLVLAVILFLAVYRSRRPTGQGFPAYGDTNDVSPLREDHIPLPRGLHGMRKGAGAMNHAHLMG